MPKQFLKSALLGAVSATCLLSLAYAGNFNIPGGDLANALEVYTAQSGVQLVVSHELVKNIKTHGVTGSLSSNDALTRLLNGTGLSARREDGAVAIVQQQSTDVEDLPRVEIAQAAPAKAIETVTVTSSKLGGADVQSIPIAITALSQEQLTATQTAGGPDLIKEVPNMTFTKTNFSGYNIQIRGIGTQAISVTTDPAVAVAFNDIPFLRNHFFEQEFYDVGQVEVLRGPQGTLYGRNATAGVVNVVSAKPSDQFEAMASADIGNYQNRRLEAMINLPIVDDRLDLRVAGEWTKRNGYSFNSLTDAPIDGRDLWSGRVTLGWNPSENVHATLVWEHFSEDDDRLRSGKQLCKTAPPASNVSGGNDFLSQGCEATSLYSPSAFETPYASSLAYFTGFIGTGVPIDYNINPYTSTTQSRNLRVIESALNPVYKAKNDTLELNVDYTVTPTLTFTSQTGYNQDFLWSTEDYDRFDGAPGIFQYETNNRNFTDQNAIFPNPNGLHVCGVSQGSCAGLALDATCTPSSSSDGDCLPEGVFCDPQLGCSDRLVAEDLSDEHAWQLSQEFRFASNFSGPLNFSVGGNYLHYETEENYYVFINTLSLFSLYNAQGPYIPGVTDNSDCLPGGKRNPSPSVPVEVLSYCRYMDPNPIGSLNNEGHNYFLSQNPYTLNSYAGFGEVYYDIAKDLKLTGGLRWTEDRKHFLDIPSEVVVPGYGYTVTNVADQQWDQLTGRAAVNWSPKLDFTDQTLVYGSFAHGYKAGGANPPGAIFPIYLNGTGQTLVDPIHPLTFKPEFIDAFELGSKNTLLDGALTLNGDVFYYNYENYQISRIVDRTAINDNFDAHVEGAELEGTYEPLLGLRLNFAGGWEDTALARGDHSVDLMDRTAGNPDWIVVKPFVTQASNCILPTYVVAALASPGSQNVIHAGCNVAYSSGLDPVTGLPYVANPSVISGGGAPPAGYIGFNPGTAPNNGQGFDKNLGGNQLPNAPPFTVSFGAQYTLPITTDWASTARADYYWQDYSWARVFNDNPYDRLRGYTNVNLTLIFTNQNGWQVMGYVKNVFNVTAITGDFLNSDDTGLTTNVFLTDPRLFGVRVTKNW